MMQGQTKIKFCISECISRLIKAIDFLIMFKFSAFQGFVSELYAEEKSLLQV